MAKKRYIVFLFFVCALSFAVPASAQDDKKGIVIDLSGATGNLTVRRDLQTMAQIELIAGDQVYHLNIPVTVQIDASAQLSDAKFSGPVAQQVGILLFEPTEMERVTGKYEKGHRSASPGPNNALVVYRADVTNLTNEALDTGYTSNLGTSAIDEAGSMYEEEVRICGEVNPNEKVSCEFIFDVPATANLVGIEIRTLAYKQFDFSGLNTQR
jgi:hypothetical protein